MLRISVLFLDAQEFILAIFSINLFEIGDYFPHLNVFARTKRAKSEITFEHSRGKLPIPLILVQLNALI